MESLIQFITENAPFAHYVLFGLLILAGLNIPISEDLVVIGSGVLASSVIPENGWKLFIAVFLGAYLSDILAYFIGRFLGQRVLASRFFSKFVQPERLVSVYHYYEKYGMLTLFCGRFIPFGVRNCLFITAGMGKMRLHKFLVVDVIACLITTATLFTLSYFFAKNYAALRTSIQWVNFGIFVAFLFAVFTIFWYKKRKQKASK